MYPVNILSVMNFYMHIKCEMCHDEASYCRIRKYLADSCLYFFVISHLIKLNTLKRLVSSNLFIFEN